MPNTRYYIAASRFAALELPSDELTGAHITIAGERFLELHARGRKRHSIRVLNSLTTDEQIILVK